MASSFWLWCTGFEDAEFEESNYLLHKCNDFEPEISSGVNVTSGNKSTLLQRKIHAERESVRCASCLAFFPVAHLLAIMIKMHMS